MAKQNKRTRIVCTLGPASANSSTLQKMMSAGMDVARLNFSHATHKDHARVIRQVRATARKLGKHIPIIADLQGPKIRLGKLPDEGVVLKAGSVIVLSTALNVYKGSALPVTYSGLDKDVKKGERFLIDDGLLELRVQKIAGNNIHAKVITGGKVTSHKGMNFPDSTLHVSAITKKDKADAIFGVEHGVDWVALSFVTNPKDVKALKRLILKHTPKGQTPARVIVKIEKPAAIENFDSILDAADGVMVARGDLGIEIDAEDVPIRQKEMIDKCRRVGKPVVVATQMMDSMIRNPRPTRAEVSDVANAVFDHTDGVMLSGESATGDYPLATVKMMSKIVMEAEDSIYDDIALELVDGEDSQLSAARAIKLLSMDGAIHGVIASHELAPWSERVLTMHPEIPLYIATKDARVARQVSLHWSAVPFVIKTQKEATFVRVAIAKLKKQRLIKKGTRLVVVTGHLYGDGIDLVTVE
jgi:pyruvate kinase